MLFLRNRIIGSRWLTESQKGIDDMSEMAVERKNSGMEFSYMIRWENDFSQLAEAVGKLENFNPSKICIVADSTVAALYLDEVKEALKSLPVTVESWIFPAGEENKNLNTVSDLYRFLIDRKFGRRDVLAALGGGVTGDLTGFTAATYLRGIDFIQIPTTLLAQVDSSVGGKTGVDFDQFKNMVGAFHQPRLVYMNMSTIKTLPADQFASGLGEVVKTAEIRSKDLFYWMIAHRDIIMERDPQTLTKLIRECCCVKANVVEEDPTEKGVRAILNFGHTLGHAVEKCKNFDLLHGQCVGIGIVAASWISMKRGMISEEDYRNIVEANRMFGIPTETSGITADDIIAATKSDKKMQAGRIKFVLLDGIGNAVVDYTVTDEEMREACAIILNK